MRKSELEQLIWDTRSDFFKYLTEHTLTARNFEEERLLRKQSFKEIYKLGIKTETEYQLAKENAKLKKEIEDLKNKIEVLVQMCCDNINNIGKF